MSNSSKQGAQPMSVPNANSGIKCPPAMNVGLGQRKLSIAVVYGRNPLPMRRADQMTVAHLLAFLKTRGHDVDLYNLDTGGSPDLEEQAWLQTQCREIKAFPHGKLDFVFAILKALGGLPMQVGLFSSKVQKKSLLEAVKQDKYDLVYTYYFRSAEVTRDIKALAKGKGPATFLAMQLSQTLNTQRIAKNAPNWAYRLFYSLESSLVAHYESIIWRDFDRTVLIGRNDAKMINEVCRENGQEEIDNVFFCAHGVDTNRFRYRDDIEEIPGKLVFSGVMRTPTNIQAVQWFVQNVWPIIHSEMPEATFDIVGREPSAEVQALGQVAGVTVVGTVPDTSIPIAQAAVCINSMQAGGGMQNKLIEYLAGAKAVVATSVANEGIGATSGEHLLIADAPADFAAKVLSLLRDDEKRRTLGAAARQFILDEWTWEAHFLKLEQAFLDAVDERAA